MHVDSSLTTAPSPFAIHCPHCQHRNADAARFCEGCGTPLADMEYDLLHRPALRQGRKWMGIVAGLYLLGGALMAAVTWSSAPETAVGLFILHAALALTQGGLWWWAKRAPFPAAVVSLALYVTMILLSAIADPMTLLRGWLIKILFITALVKAVQAGMAAKKLAQSPPEHQEPAW